MRRPLNRALRWEVFVRDGFACRYCGKGPSTHKGTVLEVDHRYPQSKGGSDELDNLVTACFQCNNGKGAHVLERASPVARVALPDERVASYPEIPDIPAITIFVRHSDRCEYKAEAEYMKCRCRKHLRYSYQGKQYRKSAKTRSWELAIVAKMKLEAYYESVVRALTMAS